MSSGCSIEFQCETCGEYLALSPDPRGSGITMLVEPCDCTSNPVMKERDEQKNRAINAESKLVAAEALILLASQCANGSSAMDNAISACAKYISKQKGPK